MPRRHRLAHAGRIEREYQQPRLRHRPNAVRQKKAAYHHALRLMT